MTAARTIQARWPSARPNLAAERAFWRGDDSFPQGGAVRLARLAHNQEVGGSNPLPATTIDGHALLLDAPRRPNTERRPRACPAEAERRRMHPLPATRRGRRDLLIVVVMSIALSIAAIIVGMLR